MFAGLLARLLDWFIDLVIHWFIYSFIHPFIHPPIHVCMHAFDWLIDWWIDGLMDWWIDGLMDWWIDGLMDWLIDWWIDWLMDGLIDWVIDWSMDWSINFWLNHCLVLCLMDWTKREKKKASNDWLLGLCVSGSQWHGSNSWKYQFDFSYSLDMLWIIWSTLYLKTKCLFSFKSSPNHEMERVNGPLTSANLVVPAPLNHMDHPSTLCISPFLPCLTTKPVWLLLDPQNKPRNMPSSLSNIDSSGKLEKHPWQEAIKEVLRSQSF